MEIKRIFLAGFLIMLVWIFWGMFFTSPPLSDNEENSSLKKEAPAKNKKDERDEGAQEQKASSLEVASPQEFEIKTNLFTARLSNAMGGTFLQYTLNDEKYKGAYTKESSGFSWDSKKHSYDKNAPLSFLFTSDEGFVSCNPCLDVDNELFDTKNQHEVFINGIPLKDLPLPIIVEKKTVVEFRSHDFKHTITLEPSSYKVLHRYETSESLEKQSPRLVWLNGTRPSEKYGWLDDQNSYGMFMLKNGEDSDYLTGNSETDPLSFKDLEWAASRNKFFISAIIPSGSSVKGGEIVPREDLSFSKMYKNRGSNASVYDIKIDFENYSEFEFYTFLAPLEYSTIRDSEIKDLDKIMTMGGSFFRPISKLILNVITFLNKNLPFGGYALVLIVFAFLVRLIAGPLTKKSLQSTRKMQEVQPIVKEIQEKYKSDPKKMQMKIMEAYKSHNVNPLSGCFLMLLQWPIMIPPFILFRSIVELRGEPLFGWIQDLALPDYMFELPFHVPLIGIGNGFTGVGLLPILMGLSLYLTMKQSSVDMPQQNKIMLYTMNGMFVFLFNSFPAGLNLYYVVYNILNYFQQRRISQDKKNKPGTSSSSRSSQKPPFWAKLIKKK